MAISIDPTFCGNRCPSHRLQLGAHHWATSVALLLVIDNYYKLLAVMQAVDDSYLQCCTNGQLPVAVNHNQLRAMASETVDTIYLPFPPPHHSQGSTSRAPRIARYKCGLKSQDFLQQQGHEHKSLGMPGSSKQPGK